MAKAATLLVVPEAACGEDTRLCASVAGQILERINGRSVSAILADKEWKDIRYLRAMLLVVRACAIHLGAPPAINCIAAQLHVL